jgi:hypothetical protein
MRDNQWTPKVVADVRTTAGEHSMPVLLVTPRGEQLGINGVRLPVSTFTKLVETLHAKSFASHVSH